MSRTRRHKPHRKPKAERWHETTNPAPDELPPTRRGLRREQWRDNAIPPPPNWGNKN